MTKKIKLPPIAPKKTTLNQNNLISSAGYGATGGTMGFATSDEPIRPFMQLQDPDGSKAVMNVESMITQQACFLVLFSMLVKKNICTAEELERMVNNVFRFCRNKQVYADNPNKFDSEELLGKAIFERLLGLSETLISKIQGV